MECGGCGGWVCRHIRTRYLLHPKGCLPPKHTYFRRRRRRLLPLLDPTASISGCRTECHMPFVWVGKLISRGGQTVLKHSIYGKLGVPGLEPATSSDFSNHGAVAVRVHVCCAVILPLPSATNPFYQPKRTTEAQKPPVGALQAVQSRMVAKIYLGA